MSTRAHSHDERMDEREVSGILRGILGDGDGGREFPQIRCIK